MVVSYVYTHVGLKISGFAKTSHAVCKRAKELTGNLTVFVSDFLRVTGVQIVDAHILNSRQELFAG
jgi:hypothetical protein